MMHGPIYIRIMCAVFKMADVCSYLILCLPYMLLRNFLGEFDMFSVAPIIVGITFAFTRHAVCIPILRSLCVNNVWLPS